MNDPDLISQPRRLVRAIAWGLSAAASPFLVTAITAALVVLLLRPPLGQLLLWAAICILFAAIVPFLFVYWLWRMGKATDMHLALREQRGAPMVVALLSTAVGVGLLYAVRAPAPLVALGVVYLANGAVLTLVSRRWKISVHTAVLSTGLLGLALVGYPQALWALPLVPLVLWARVYRGKHTVAQGAAPVLLTAFLTPPVYWAAIWVLAGR